jgi:hypothetical protein
MKKNFGGTVVGGRTAKKSYIRTAFKRRKLGSRIRKERIGKNSVKVLKSREKFVHNKWLLNILTFNFLSERWDFSVRCGEDARKFFFSFLLLLFLLFLFLILLLLILLFLLLLWLFYSHNNFYLNGAFISDCTIGVSTVSCYLSQNTRYKRPGETNQHSHLLSVLRRSKTHPGRLGKAFGTYIFFWSLTHYVACTRIIK